MARNFSEHDRVRSDIAEIFEFIADDDPNAALKVVKAIRSSIKTIIRDPERFPKFHPTLFKNENLRRTICLPYRNYLVFFELTLEEIRILYIHHAARDFDFRHLNEKRR